MNKFFILAGSITGALGVTLGAFGAHALKNFLESSGRLETYETAVKYMFYHALALILVGILSKEFPVAALNNAGWAFLIGIVIFSGSLFLLCATGIKILGAITPIGGVAMIAGWLLLFWGIYKG
jgi:uncharacterized membrane protein YgdD (TMEM256/DUF423 family)